MNEVNPKVYGETEKTPEFFIRLLPKKGQDLAKITIVNEEGEGVHCGNLLTFTDKGVSFNSCVNVSAAEKAGLPRSMFCGSTLKEAGRIETVNIVKNTISYYEIPCDLAGSDTLNLENRGCGSLWFSVSADGLDGTPVALSMDKVEELRDRLSQHLAAFD